MKKYISEAELTTLINQLNLDEMDDYSGSEETSVDASSSDKHNNKQDGWIRIVNQQIYVQNPINGGDYAIIYPMSPVKLYINDKEVAWESKVTAEDRLSWVIEEQPLFDISISEDKLLAHLLLHAKERFPWRLVDGGPANRLMLRVEEDRDIVLKTVQLGDVVSKLEEMSIKARIEFAAIQQELLLPTYQPVIVARGKEPIPGKDARLEIYFAQQVESQFFEVEGTIDYRNHLRIPSVQKGEVMARKIPLVDGIAGYDVLGSITIPSTPKDLFIVAKSNVELTPDGAVIARIQGRPRMTGGKIKTFDVSTSYIVSGNVDIETGNIVFSGDVVIYGDVTDNMIIESLGNVYVYGNVYNSTITATGSINVRGNVVASKLYSGYFGVLFNRLYHTSKLLCDYIERLLAASKLLVEALESKRQAVRYGQIILLLMETKMKEIPDTIKELQFVISNIQHIKQEEYEKLKEISGIFSQPTKLLEVATYGFVQSFLTLLQDTHKEVARMQEENVEISINQCHNSELKSNGDIVIHRDGVLLCDLYSARNIIFMHDNSICRGSRLEAGDSISAKVIGGQTGANSVLKAKRKVQVKKMYSGRVCIGKYCKDIFEPVDNTTFDIQTLKKNA
ncbi:FapA family protein [Cohnella silvisoli]|uniref:FapA family protein n=1 Tax=Cohnella silvisoli TaxID=2873699 RepID=A0ABV1KQB2_9BACL|nr:FapA family protein [Cohnella silvisoli]MCD9022068.1 FapA family protein [Cohnella silvisoli]